VATPGDEEVRVSDPYAGIRVPDEERARLIRSVFEPSGLDETARAVSVATETESQLYVERFGDRWRWSLVHGGGPYPLLRVTARFLKVDYTAISIGHRQIEGGLSVLTRDLEEVGDPHRWMVAVFDGPGPVPEGSVRERLLRECPGPTLRRTEAGRARP
jgi:hypothetical protein